MKESNTSTNTPPYTAPPPPGQSLTSQSARGFVWMLAQTIGSKIFSFAAQIVLARLLAPRDFGLVALAYTVVAIAAVIRQTGIQQILVQRHKHYRRWVNPAFWFELSVGLATAAALVVAAPIAASVFHSRELAGLVLVIAVAAPLNAWYVVPNASLMIDMRFRAIAAVSIGYNLVAMATSIALALLGFGAYSFVIPLLTAGILRGIWLWWLARPPIRLKPQIRRWRFLVGDSGYMLGTGFLGSLVLQSGSLALGLFCTKAVVGQFFLAFNLSTQVWQLLSQNLGSVLLPALAKLQDDRPRQVAALLRASRMLAFIGLPLSLLLAVVAKPAVLIFYGSRWLPAVSVLRILAVAMAFGVPSFAAYTAMQSQGRFRAVFLFTAAQLPIFLLSALIGATAGGAVGVAIGWLIGYVLVSPLWVGIACDGRDGWRGAFGVYAGPFLASGLALAPAAAMIAWWRPIAGQYFAQGALAAASLAILYPVLGALSCPAEFRELASQAKAVVARLTGGSR